MTEKRKRGRPKGSGAKKPEIRRVDPVSPQVAAAVHNAEHSEQFTEIQDKPPEWTKTFFENNPDATTRTENLSLENPISEPTESIYTFEPKEGIVTKNGKVISEKLLPPAGLSKTETLAWYTKNRIK